MTGRELHLFAEDAHSAAGPAASPTALPPPTGLEQALQYWSTRGAVRNSGRRLDFAAGWEAALTALERCATHWEAFGMNEAGRVSVEALRDAVKVTRAGWECTEPGHPAACRADGPPP